MIGGGGCRGENKWGRSLFDCQKLPKYRVDKAYKAVFFCYKKYI